MLAEPTEGEEAFFHYENGLMAKVKGYYIYYEKKCCYAGMYGSKESNPETGIYRKV